MRVPLSLSLTVLGLLAGLTLPQGALLAQTAAKDAVVATIDGKPITEKDLELAYEELAASLPPQVSDAQKRDYAISYLADIKAGAQAAIAAKLDQGEDYLRRLNYTKDKLLLEAYLAAETKKQVTEEKMRKLYEDSIKAMKPELEIKARHILVPTEEEAKTITAKLKSGEDFAKLAQEFSKDPGSGKEGGDLGWFTTDRMVPEFGEAASKMKPGQVSDPVKTQFGWHIIKVEDMREKKPPSYDEVKDQVQQFLERQVQTDIIGKLRTSLKIEKKDAPAAAPAAPAASAPATPATQPKK
jgi:peptidyl-prolyl cis-trans isomerase C